MMHDHDMAACMDELMQLLFKLDGVDLNIGSKSFSISYSIYCPIVECQCSST